MAHRVALSLAVVLAFSLACTGRFGAEREVCEAYLECVATVAPSGLAAARAAYGDESGCWESASDAQLCQSACQSELITLDESLLGAEHSCTLPGDEETHDDVPDEDDIEPPRDDWEADYCDILFECFPEELDETTFSECVDYASSSRAQATTISDACATALDVTMTCWVGLVDDPSNPSASECDVVLMA